MRFYNLGGKGKYGGKLLPLPFLLFSFLLFQDDWRKGKILGEYIYENRYPSSFSPIKHNFKLFL